MVLEKKGGDMTEGLKRIGLEKAIAVLRTELINSIVASRGEGLRFEVDKIMLEFHIEAERNFGS